MPLTPVPYAISLSSMLPGTTSQTNCLHPGPCPRIYSQRTQSIINLMWDSQLEKNVQRPKLSNTWQPWKTYERRNHDTYGPPLSKLVKKKSNKHSAWLCKCSLNCSFFTGYFESFLSCFLNCFLYSQCKNPRHQPSSYSYHLSAQNSHTTHPFQAQRLPDN